MDLRTIIHDYLRESGIPAWLIGFPYIRCPITGMDQNVIVTVTTESLVVSDEKMGSNRTILALADPDCLDHLKLAILQTQAMLILQTLKKDYAA